MLQFAHILARTSVGKCGRQEPRSRAADFAFPEHEMLANRSLARVALALLGGQAVFFLFSRLLLCIGLAIFVHALCSRAHVLSGTCQGTPRVARAASLYLRRKHAVQSCFDAQQRCLLLIELSSSTLEINLRFVPPTPPHWKLQRRSQTLPRAFVLDARKVGFTPAQSCSPSASALGAEPVAAPPIVSAMISRLVAPTASALQAAGSADPSLFRPSVSSQPMVLLGFPTPLVMPSLSLFVVGEVILFRRLEHSSSTGREWRERLLFHDASQPQASFIRARHALHALIPWPHQRAMAR